MLLKTGNSEFIKQTFAMVDGTVLSDVTTIVTSLTNYDDAIFTAYRDSDSMSPDPESSIRSYDKVILFRSGI